MKSDEYKFLRWGIILQIIGILLELHVFLNFTPFSFFVFASLGMPLIVIGAMFYIIHVLRTLQKKGAL